jgi:hypothetical protein
MGHRCRRWLGTEWRWIAVVYGAEKNGIIEAGGRPQTDVFHCVVFLANALVLFLPFPLFLIIIVILLVNFT